MNDHAYSPTGTEVALTELPGNAQDSSLAVMLARAEVDQQVATSRALPRSITRAASNMASLATLDEETAAECIYALPRGGKTIRGPSIRFAEIMASQWGNCRIAARVTHVDRFEGYVVAEGVFHDLETNVAQLASVRRTIQAKRGKGIDNDMIQLAGAAACSIARRNAILAGIPKGVARSAYLAVERVIRGDVKTLVERRDMAMKAFAAFGVTSERVCAALEVGGVGDITLDHLTTLIAVHAGVKNGEISVEEAFPDKAAGPLGPRSVESRLDDLAKGAGSPNARPATNSAAAPPSGERKAASDQVHASARASAESPAASDDSAPFHDEDGVILDEAPPARTQRPVAAPAQDTRPKVADPAPAAPLRAAPAMKVGDDPARDEATLADLRQEGERRASEGIAPLSEFEEGLTDYETDLIAPF